MRANFYGHPSLNYAETVQKPANGFTMLFELQQGAQPRHYAQDSVLSPYGKRPDNHEGRGLNLIYSSPALFFTG